MEEQLSTTIHLLFIGVPTEKAELMLNQLRHADYATRAHSIENKQDLNKNLSINHQWEFVILSDSPMPDGLDQEKVLEKIDQKGRDIPVILLVDQFSYNDNIAFYKMGGRQVCQQKNSEHFLLIIQKELKDLMARRHNRMMSAALIESENQSLLLRDKQKEAIIYLVDGIVVYVNQLCYELLDINKENIINQPFQNIIAAKDQNDITGLLTSIDANGHGIAALQFNIKVNETTTEVRSLITPTSYKGYFALRLTIKLKKTLPKVKKNKPIVHLSANNIQLDKHKFIEVVNTAIQRFLSKKQQYALLCVDIQLKTNDSSVNISSAVNHLISLLDEHKVNRWTNNQLMLLLQIKNQENIDIILKESGISEYQQNNKDQDFIISIGALMFCDQNTDANVIFKRAQMASTKAAQLDNNQVYFYRKRTISKVDRVEKHLIQIVESSINNRTLQLWYQPIVGLKNSNISYYEAFLRLKDPRGRLHNAAVFRNKLEMNPLWKKLDEWQVTSILTELVRVNQQKPSHLFIHFGGYIINDNKMLLWFNEMVKLSGANPNWIILEISEQHMTALYKKSSELINNIKSFGYKVSISEFGCSVDPIKNISALDVDYVKLDNSFSKDLTNKNEQQELIEIVEQLVKLNINVMVSNVTRADDMTPLWHCGVDLIQGDFLHSSSTKMENDSDFDKE